MAILGNLAPLSRYVIIPLLVVMIIKFESLAGLINTYDIVVYIYYTVH